MTDFKFKRSWGPQPNYPRVMQYHRSEPGSTPPYNIAGPCSVETPEQIHEVARHVSKCGATHLRGGVYRAGTYPRANMGWVPTQLLEAYWTAARSFNLLNVIEVLDYSDSGFSLACQYGDVLQVGCRQMQNYKLLAMCAKSSKPIFLKRNPGSTIDEFLGAAEHLLQVNQYKEIVLIERGSSTNATHVRWDLSISMIPAIKEITGIPIVVDASHGTGRRDLVAPMTLAGIAAGADGCLVETHPVPENSLSDADQAISFQEYENLMMRVKRLKGVL